MFLPPVPDSFKWTIKAGIVALHCQPLAVAASHLFTTRQTQLLTKNDWVQLAAAVGAQEVLQVMQGHGSSVLVVQPKKPLPSCTSKADVLLSGVSNVSVAVRSADCAPLLIADTGSGAVAAVHAGWRGTAVGAATAAVESLQRNFGSNPSDLIVAIGPCIRPCCYEVGIDVVNAFEAQQHVHPNVRQWFRETRSLNTTKQLFSLDLVAANCDQLVLAGVPKNQIHTAGLCTAMHLDLFPSFRFEKEMTSRMAGIIKPSHSVEEQRFV